MKEPIRAKTRKEKITFREIAEADEFRCTRKMLPIVVGKRVDDRPTVIDLAQVGHLLCVGMTGSGKSAFLHSLIASVLLCFSPTKLKLILIDIKGSEFDSYRQIPHLQVPIIQDPTRAVLTLKWVLGEIDRRVSGRRLLCEKLTRLIVCIDEYADLILADKKRFESLVATISEKGARVGVHLVLSTHCASTDVVTRSIKKSLPSRVCFRVASASNSKAVLGRLGGERLSAAGDLLLLREGSDNIFRVHGSLVGEKDTQTITKLWKAESRYCKTSCSGLGQFRVDFSY